MDTVRVRRNNGEFESVSSSELVPGDVIELPRHQGTVVCDAVLLTGHCIVNESMLTGTYNLLLLKNHFCIVNNLFFQKESRFL